MPDPASGGSPLDDVLNEVRVKREHLQDLIGRLRRERDTWQRSMFSMTTRSRLTITQRQRFNIHFAALTRHRVP